MPTALGVDLILQVQTGYTVVLEDRDRAGSTHGFTETGVGIDQRREVGDPRDLLAVGGDLGQRGQPDVGKRQSGGIRTTRNVDTFEPDFLNELGCQRIDRTGESLNLSGRQPGPEGNPLVGCRRRCGNEARHQKSPLATLGARARTSSETVKVS